MRIRTTYALAVAALAMLATASTTLAQYGGQAPLLGPAPRGGGQQPILGASPLAGGPNAAVGDSFVDAHGNPIILQTAYSPGYAGGGCYGGCQPGGMGGDMNNGVYADFGGYGQEQVGPHYFDLSFDAVFYGLNDFAAGAASLTSVGIGAATPRFGPFTDDSTGYSPGFRAAARYDIGPLSVIEAIYTGVEGLDGSNRIVSTEVSGGLTNFLFTPESADASAVLNPAFDGANVHATAFDSDLHSTEFNVRRYWVGNRPRISGTYLAGFRYLRISESLAFTAIDSVGGGGTATWAGENDLLGGQMGADMSIALRQGLRVSLEGKGGVYNNRFKFSSAATGEGASADDGNRVAFAGELGVQLVADILPSFSIKGGYQLLFVDSLANVAGNIADTGLVPTSVNSTGDSTYDGVNVGLEYIW